MSSRNAAGGLAFWLLKTLSKRPEASSPEILVADPDVRLGSAKLERFFGADVWSRIRGKVVLDYGCGHGDEVVAAAIGGARRAIGLDVRSRVLSSAAERAARRGVASSCEFFNALDQPAQIDALKGKVDLIYSLDCFEHYPDPAGVLGHVYELLAPGGAVLISFGPPWKHPYGAHMSFFCPVPWVQLLFSEETILAVRSLYRHDGARRYSEVDGGLNCMTVGRFEALARASGFALREFQPVPVRGWTWLVKTAFLREYFTSVVRCVLLKPNDAPPQNKHERIGA